MEAKTCTQCGETKLLDAFHRRGRRDAAPRPRCKPCHRAAVRTHRAENVAHYRAYQQQLRVEGYYDDRPGDPAKVKARAAVKRALKNGTLVRPPACERCHKPCKPHGHHTDYTRPLVVQWLCRCCHGEAHRLPSEVAL